MNIIKELKERKLESEKENDRNNKNNGKFGLNYNDKESLLKDAQKYGEQIIEALNYAVSPFLLIEWAKIKLNAAGFTQIYEKDIWKLTLGQKYYLTRNHSSIIIITVGQKVDLKDTAFVVVGGHTDSPSLRFAPNSYLVDNTYEKYNLQTYGGGQWQTWFDRDLSITGKAVVVNPTTNKLETRLLRFLDPIIFIPNLPIHLRTETGFTWNNETHLKAITSSTFFDDEKSLEDEVLTSVEKKIGKKLANLLSMELKVDKDSIFDCNLILYDTNPAKFSGIQKEFISSGRFDNLGTSITSTLSMIEASNNMDTQTTINICTLFDSEEVGSQTYQGAFSSFFKDTLIRIFSSVDTSDSFNTSMFNNYFQAACSKSFVLSCDMAHLYHPNYPGNFQSEHRPLPNKGPTIKINAQSKYSTECEGSSLIKLIAKDNNIPIQEFIVRQDSPCGTTIGPLIAGKSGIRTADIGCPQLAMHSIREQTAVVDLYFLGKFFIGFYNDYITSVGMVYDQ